MHEEARTQYAIASDRGTRERRAMSSWLASDAISDTVFIVTHHGGRSTQKKFWNSRVGLDRNGHPRSP